MLPQLLIGGATLLSGLMGRSAAKSAANTQARAARDAAAASERNTDRQIAYAGETRDMIRRDLDPFRRSGVQANALLSDELLGGFQASPGYDFARTEGMRAIDGSAAARGGLFSGATLKAQQEFGTGLANQEYGNWLNRVSGMAGSGQNAAGMTANAATNASGQIVNSLANLGSAQQSAIYGAGNARAAGQIGSANALTDMFRNGIGAYQYFQNAAPQMGSTGPMAPHNTGHLGGY